MEEKMIVQKEKEVTYPLSELIENAKAAFAVTPEVAAGAFVRCGKAELSVLEAKGFIKNFLKSKAVK